MEIINVIGLGVTGSATAEVLRRLGHQVRVFDVSRDRQRQLEDLGFAPLRKDEGDVTLVCVPESNVRSALDIAPPNSMWILRSTTIPGETKALENVYDHHIIHFPEFLREAVALQDALSPNYLLIGECCLEHGSVVEKLFTPLLAPIVRVDSTTSEMVKLVANAHLSTLISFWNQIYMICSQLGLNSMIIGKIASQDPRISPYGAIRHGERFDGSCLPKDLEAIIALAERSLVDPLLLTAVRSVNESMSEATTHDGFGLSDNLSSLRVSHNGARPQPTKIDRLVRTEDEDQ